MRGTRVCETHTDVPHVLAFISGRLPAPLFLLAVDDHRVLDAVVDLRRENSLLEQIQTSTVRAKTYDALGPGAGKPLHLQQVVHGGMIQVDPFRGRNRPLWAAAVTHGCG
jgi:hypothetical protein